MRMTTVRSKTLNTSKSSDDDEGKKKKKKLTWLSRSRLAIPGTDIN